MMIACDKDTSASFCQRITISGNTKRKIAQAKEEFYKAIPFSRYYIEIDTSDKFTKAELKIMRELDLLPD